MGRAAGEDGGSVEKTPTSPTVAYFGFVIFRRSRAFGEAPVLCNDRASSPGAHPVYGYYGVATKKKKTKSVQLVARRVMPPSLF